MTVIEPSKEATMTRMTKTTMAMVVVVAALVGGCGPVDELGGNVSDLQLMRHPGMEAASRAGRIATASLADTTALTMARTTVTLPTAGGAVVPPASSPTCTPPSAFPNALVQTSISSDVALPNATTYRFRLDQTNTVYVAALVRNVCGKHQASFDVYAPDGTFYTRLAAPSVAGGDASRPPGAGYPTEPGPPVPGPAT